MTQTQFVDYSGRGFWAYDVALGVLLKHLIDAAEARNANSHHDEWLAKLVSDWRRIACISDFGLTLGPDWSDEQLHVFVELVERACEKLAQRDAIPSREMESWPILEDLRLFARGAVEVETAPVIELGRAIVALVRGGLPPPPKGRHWLYGTPDGPEAI